MADWETSFRNYSIAYSTFSNELNAWHPSVGPLEDALAEATVGVNTALVRLSEAQAAYHKLLPLLDGALKKDIISGVASDQASESDVRRYFVVAGEYLDQARQDLLASKEAYSLPPRAYGLWTVSHSGSRKVKKLLATYREMDALRFKLFGQHLQIYGHP
jgi:hypothetical protein